MPANRFRASFNRKPVFVCECCGHRTRETGQDDDRFCGPCVELLMMQNTLWDGGAGDWLPKARDEFVAKISKRGGDLAKVRAFMPDLFDVEGYEAKRAARRSA